MTCTAFTPPTIYTQEQIQKLDPRYVPSHIAIIPDGNRRWAKRKQTTTEEGHREGGEILMDIVKASKELGIQIITFYLFSTENWSRSNEEFHALMWLLQSYLNEQCDNMIQNGIRLQTIGNLTRFPEEIVQTIQKVKQATAHCNKIDMVFALNYGGRDDITRAFQKILGDPKNRELKPEEISESMISRYLDTAQWRDPDLLIRTSGEMRLSNFLLWQISYTEVYVADILWPDFTPGHLLEAIFNFQKRERRLGGA